MMKNNIEELKINHFLISLYNVVNDNQHADIVSWTSDGEGLFIRDTVQFEQMIIPVYFNHTKFTSFVR